MEAVSVFMVDASILQPKVSLNVYAISILLGNCVKEVRTYLFRPYGKQGITFLQKASYIANTLQAPCYKLIKTFLNYLCRAISQECYVMSYC